MHPRSDFNDAPTCFQSLAAGHTLHNRLLLVVPALAPRLLLRRLQSVLVMLWIFAD
jgi:hypothetical protein